MLEISWENYEVLNDASLLPRWGKDSPNAKHHPFSVRVYGEGDVLPTIPASYRTAIQFSRGYLSGNRLMSWVIRDAQGATRWLWQPAHWDLGRTHPCQRMRLRPWRSAICWRCGSSAHWRPAELCLQHLCRQHPCRVQADSMSFEIVGIRMRCRYEATTSSHTLLEQICIAGGRPAPGFATNDTLFLHVGTYRR